MVAVAPKDVIESKRRGVTKQPARSSVSPDHLPAWLMETLERARGVELPEIDINRPSRMPATDDDIEVIYAAIDHARRSGFELPEIDISNTKANRKSK